jgi:predicted nucleotidyltransferase
VGENDRVTKVDERAHVPALDVAALERLAAALDQKGVVAAMIIGSQARREASALADVDLAVWLEDGLSGAERRSLRARLHGASAAALRTSEVDLVVLNDASPLLRHRALRDRKLIVDRDEQQRVRVEVRSVLEYLDTAPLRALRLEALRARLASDSFGRP